MSNFGFRVAMREMGIETAEADVGDRYVLNMMRERALLCWAVKTPDISFPDRHTTGDGIISALQLLAIRQARAAASQLAQIIRLAPQQLINVNVPAKPPLETIAPCRRPSGLRNRLGRQRAGADSLFRHAVHLPGYGGKHGRKPDGRTG